MSTPTVNQYRIFCITENDWVTSWGTTPPTTCTNNTAHTVNPNSVQQLQSVSSNSVFVNTDRVPTGGNYRTVGYIRNIPAGATGTVYTFDASYPYPVNLTLVSFRSDYNAAGDIINADAAPDTIIGVLTAPALGTTMSVNTTVIQNIGVGIQCNLFDGTNVTQLGKCTNVDATNSVITVETPVTSTLAPGTYVRISYRNIDNYVLSNSQTRILGTGKLGSSHAPANTIFRLYYQNNNGQAKNIWIDNEFTY